ncbi:MAG: hypothetical protein SFV55_15915 [Haliscomenobacter sp.]|uniref:hypothetical protein n=1 Tax=Haliscomenobacter sp. TaxID=2717303 RepID=UPI0029BD5A74|nr:hypothetical protein [Haliscomenobacter sp.]MDX2069916.1 hypothetical protein [Haliscomenobacter sp.]
MKHFALLLLWLISALFGCNNRNSKKPEQDLPWFPNTDNSALQVMEIPLDSGYTVQTFFVSPVRKEVFVVAHTKVVISGQHKLEDRFRTDYLLLHLDANGQVLQRQELPGLRHSSSACLWLEHQNLVFYLEDKVRLYDAGSMRITEEIPCYVQHDFPSTKNLVELFPEEQLELYLPAREKALKKSVSTRVLSLPGTRALVLLVEEAKQKRSIWAILDALEIDQFTRKYGQIEPPSNPGWNYNAETGLFRVEDGSIVLESTKEVSMGTQLDYPNYKSRSAMQYELLIGGKKARFATTNRSRKPLYVLCAQNDYLSASGAEAWIAYDGTLYRLE